MLVPFGLVWSRYDTLQYRLQDHAILVSKVSFMLVSFGLGAIPYGIDIDTKTDEELYLSDYSDDNFKNIPSIEQNIKNIKVVPALKKKKVSCYENLNWQKEPPKEGMRRFNFISEEKVNGDIKNSDPLELFEYIITNELCEYIAEQTNIYFNQMTGGKVFQRSSRIFKFINSGAIFTSRDIRLHFAVIIYCGIIRKPKLRMSTLLTAGKLLQPGRDISIDESLLLWKGRLSFKQSIRSKSAHFGIKTFALACGKTGYVWNQIIYLGAGTEISQQYKYQATDVVMSLSEELLDVGRCIYLDNWYTSLEICDFLIQRKTDVVGTLRSYRKYLPKDVINAKLKSNERCVAYEQGYQFMVMQWKDKRDVYMITTCIPDTLEIVLRKGARKEVPTVIHIYNSNMGGVDLSDQMTTSYACERKRVKKWYKKFYFHLINLSIFNAQVIHKMLGGKLKALEFRMQLVSALVSFYGYDIVTSGQGGRLSLDGNPMRLVHRHFPSYAPETECKTAPQRRCVVCRKKGKRKDSRYECTPCDVGLCAAPCFQLYHSKKYY
ncbi:piggyBac transposable element-derived protein 4-like [Hydra vulgaris]|uniref:PiggyBac transposable element-derived protein 4-like n=1 Tax=Hydra vulgaris TaxID=6087 RepID=A0ABM4BPI5_HYDVU